jgi:tetrahydromethanopterin S-methyltransferase subunit F
METRFRQRSVLAGLLSVLLAAGLAHAASDADDSPIQEIMEQVNTRNRAIGRALRSSSALESASRKGLAADAASLVQLGKKARALTGPARDRQKPQAEWTRAADDLLRAAEELAKVIADPGSSRPRATQSYQKLQKTCINCHSAFRE